MRCIGITAIELQRVDLAIRHEVAIRVDVDDAFVLVHRQHAVDIPFTRTDRMREVCRPGRTDTGDGIRYVRCPR